MITTINEFKNSLNENKNYDKLLNKTFDLFNNGKLYTILDYGDRDELYIKHNMSIPHNPMGYAYNNDTHFLVKTTDGNMNILSDISKKAFKLLNNEETVNNLTKLTDLTSLKIGDVVYYKVSDNQYNRGDVVDDFGTSKFFIFTLPIKLDSNYSGKSFELESGENPEIESKLYVKL